LSPTQGGEQARRPHCQSYRRKAAATAQFTNVCSTAAATLALPESFERQLGDRVIKRLKSLTRTRRGILFGHGGTDVEAARRNRDQQGRTRAHPRARRRVGNDAARRGPEPRGLPRRPV